MKKLILSPIMIILVPLDYIGWNLFMGSIDLKDSIRECWEVL